MPRDDWTLDDLIQENREGRQEVGLPVTEEHKDTSDYVEREWGNYNKSIYVSLDPGKKQDYSALIFLEPFIPFDEGTTRYTYHISRIHRFPLETPYPRIARVLKKVHTQLLENPDIEYVYITIDVGGVGEAVADQIVELISDTADIYRFTFTSGLRAKWHDARDLSVPKPQLASTLISLFESHRLWVAPQDKEQLAVLQEELMNYERKITASGYDKFGAVEKMGAHDDLISAISMAAYLAERNSSVGEPLW